MGLVAPALALAGAWPQGANKWQVIHTASYYKTDSYNDNNGDRLPQPPYKKYEYNPYVEYGLNGRATLGLNALIDYVEGSSGLSRSHNFGLVDTELFVRHTLFEKSGFITSLEPAVKLPSLYQKSGLPKSGSADADAMLRLNAGYGFQAFGQSHYLDTSAGYRTRFGDRADQVNLWISAGLRLNERTTIMPQMFATVRVNEKSTSPFTQTGADDYHLIKTQLSVLYDINDRVALQLGGFHHSYTRNTGNGGGIMLGLWTRF